MATRLGLSKINLREILHDNVEFKNLRTDTTLDLTDNDIDEYLNDVNAATIDAMPEIIVELSNLLLERLKLDAPAMLKERHTDLSSIRREATERLATPASAA